MPTEAVPQQSTDSPPRAGLVLAALILGAVVANMNLGIANVALPSIGRDLDASQTQITAIANAFTLALAASVLYLGAIGDKYGRKKLFLAGAALSVPGALLSAFAPNAESLMAARFVSGLAAGMLFPVTLSMVTALFRGAAQTRAVALWTGIGVGFAALGPLIGGALLTEFWWGSVFLITIPLALLDLILGWRVLPWRAGEDADSVDHVSGVLSVVMVGSLIIALQFLPQGINPVLVGLFALAAVGLILFLRRQRSARVERPLVDLEAISVPTFWVSAVAGTISFGCLMGALFIGQQFTQNVLGYSPLKAALVNFPCALMMFVASVLAGRLMLARGSRVTFALGLAVISLGLADMFLLWGETSPLWHIVLGYSLIGLGVGSAATPASHSLMASLTVSRAGLGSAFTDLSRDFGGAVMNAVMGSMLAIVYGQSITRTIAGLPAEQQSALTGEITDRLVSGFTGAEQVAQEYPAQQSEIIGAAAQAFTEGKTWSLLIACLLTLIALGLVLLRYPSKAQEDEFFTKMRQT